MNYTIRNTEPGLWTVFDVDDNEPISDHNSYREATDEVVSLLGGTPRRQFDELKKRVAALEKLVGKEAPR